MKFALVGDVRREAQPKLRGVCESCHADLIAKCGSMRVWHWAHIGVRNCDPWWESETEWHRGWKNRFPPNWQEVRQISHDGEVHIADIKTESGIVLEFQHSNISPLETASRELFYKRMVWVVDGAARKRDLPAFQRAIDQTQPSSFDPIGWTLYFDSVPLFQRWSRSRCPVFIDFGVSFFSEFLPTDETVIWRLKIHRGSQFVTVIPVSLQSLVSRCIDGQKLRPYRYPKLNPVRTITRLPLSGFEEYLRKQEARRRQRTF